MARFRHDPPIKPLDDEVAAIDPPIKSYTDDEFAGSMLRNRQPLCPAVIRPVTEPERHRNGSFPGSARRLQTRR